MSRKLKKKIEEEHKLSEDYFRKVIEEQYQKDINKKTGTHSTLDDIAPVKDTDIAPVKERSWFDKGLFDDGYQFGDVAKTILGTNKDFSEDLSGGLARIAEGAVDTGAWAIGGIGKAFGNDDLADKMQKFEERDLVGEYKLDKRISDSLPGGQAMKLANHVLNKGDTEKASVLGEKTDSLVQSAGQLGGTMALQAVGVPWYLTTGVTSFGAGTEEAFKGGATYGEAGAYGAINAGAEVLTEKLGGIKFGGKALLDPVKKTLADQLTKKTAKNLVKFGIDMGAEGTEEVLTEVIQNLGKKLTYEDEKTINELMFSEEAMDGYLEAFIGGAVLGGSFSAGTLYQSHKTVRDYDTGLTDNEQRVVDSEIKSRSAEKQKKAAVETRISQIVEEREKTFGTLTDTEKKNIRQQVQTQLDNGEIDYTKTEIDKKELAAIEEQVREDLEKGDIGIDLIENTLSGQKTAQINDLKTELSKTTDEAKKAEIEAKINELTAAKATELKSMLSKDFYLQESYRQEALKKEAFARETTETDSDITKELIESAKAANMNNTRKMHDLFEYTNKIANDAKVKYGFVNNEQLKELGHEAEGATINGLVRVDKDGKTKVLINVDSDKALNTIIGHETTHLLENTEEYKALQDIVKQYATTKGDYDARMKSLSKLYEGVDANIENEITADLVGDYLFTDEQFINNLSTNRNVFQKIYDYIKHAYKMATAGSQEKRELERVKRSFDKAYKQMSKATTQEAKDNLATDADSNTVYALTKYSEHQVENWKSSNNIVVYENSEQLNKFINDAKDGKLGSKKMYFGIVPENLANRVLQETGVDIKNRNVTLGAYEVQKIFKDHGNEDTEALRGQRAVTAEDFESIVEVIESPDDIRLSSETYNGRPVLEFSKAVGDKITVVTYDSKKHYDLRVQTVYVNKKRSLATATDEQASVNTSETTSGTAPTPIIPDVTKEGNNKYSLSDNQGRKLSEKQQEYFKDSKVRDENGSLKVMYHGTPAGDFTVFKDGTYFTENKEYADRYQSPSASSISYGKEATNPKTFEVYLDIKKPFDINDPEARRVYIEDYIKGGNAMGINPYLSDAEYNKIQTIDWTEGEDLRDFLIEEGYDYDGLILDEGADGGYGEDVQYRGKSYVVFNANQIKNVDNTNPTSDPDIRYSLSVSDYGMSHRPSTDYGDGSNFEENMPDVFEHPEWYFRKSEAHNMESLRALRKVRNNPEGEIIIYRATIGDTINEGDWVSPSKKYAEMHNWHSLDGKGNILELKVKAKDIRFAGDDINEFGYFPNGVDAYSLSRFDEQLAEKRGYNVYGKDVLVPKAPAPAPAVEEAPVAEDIAPVVIPEELRYEEGRALTEEDLPYVDQERDEALYSIGEDSAPFEEEEFYSVPDTSPLDDKSLKMIARNMRSELGLKPKQIANLEKVIQDYSTSEEVTKEDLYNKIEQEFGTVYTKGRLEEVAEVKRDLRSLKVKVSDTIKSDIPDYFQFKQRNFGKIRFSNQGLAVDDVYEGLKTVYPQYFPADLINPTDQLLKMAEVADLDTVYTEEYSLSEEQIQEVTDFIYESVLEYKREMAMKASHEASMLPIDESLIPKEPKVKREIAPSNFDTKDFTVSRGVQQEYDMEEEAIVDNTHDIELERLEKRKKNALEKLGDLPAYTKRQAKDLYDEVRSMHKGQRVSSELGFILDRMFKGVDKNADNYEEIKDRTYKKITDALIEIERNPEKPSRNVSDTESLIRNSIETRHGWAVAEIGDMKLDSRAEARRKLRKELMGGSTELFTKALDDAQNIPMALMNNTDTIRNTEIVFGRQNGKIINEAIYQPAIDNEAKSIAWQNKERAEIKELGIKARSKESAAVQKYGEGKYINEFGDEALYGDDELMQEFSDEATREKIKHAASVIRTKYDAYVDKANEVLTKLGFDPIKKRKDYMRHFQELNDAFSRYGIPFNAQNMQEHVLPTDINGLTEDWSPQKNFFANLQPRKGERTTLDAITGIDGYIGGIANLIYHTEDIQRGRAFEDLIRETYGKEKGWDNLEAIAEELSPEEYQARADKIQNNHLSNYAAWVHEWTNNMAGKKNRADRAIEAMFGRKGLSFLDQVRKQTGANMIGFNLSSSLTNLISPIQAMAKTDKLAVAKGTADTFKNIFIKDDFMEKNSFLIGRMGTDMLSKTPWAKAQDAAYVFMKGMDWFSSNQIVRSKYYELVSKGMSEEQAHAEAGKFAARIMGDRTKGAQAQLYNSKLIGLVTQFQLEVNNQIYSMFYDTYHESKETAKGNAAKTAAGMTFVLGQLFAFTHLFGKTFESIAGYNPTFDVIGIIATALGLGDDDEEKTAGERLDEAMQQLLKALPYASIATGGGRIPIASALPIKQFVSGEDDYGNEKSRWETVKETAPYYLMPAGYGQVKKTTQGLGMFDEDLPVSGSYTDSGNLRFPVEDTPLNRAQAALFGQWASENARQYFDEERAPLKEKQIQEYKDLDIPIAEYWEYRDGLKGLDKVEQKFDYVAGLDLPVAKKNIMINNLVDREEKVDLINYDDFGSYEEFDFAVKNPEKYSFLESYGVTYAEYNATDKTREAYNWAYENPESYTVSRAVSDVVTYRNIAGSLNDIKADKYTNGKTVTGSRKAKVANYINGLEVDYGAKLILFKSEYPSDDSYNYEIIDYLNNRQDISYTDMQTILVKLGFTVDAEGNIYW